jgi:hypothetical protein
MWSQVKNGLVTASFLLADFRRHPEIKYLRSTRATVRATSDDWVKRVTWGIETIDIYNGHAVRDVSVFQ